MIDSSCLQQTECESALRARRWHLSDPVCYPKVPLITVTCGKTSLEQIMPISLSAHISPNAWQGFFHCRADSLQERSTVSLAWHDVEPRVLHVTNKAWTQITAAFRKKEIVAWWLMVGPEIHSDFKVRNWHKVQGRSLRLLNWHQWNANKVPSCSCTAEAFSGCYVWNIWESAGTESSYKPALHTDK